MALVAIIGVGLPHAATATATTAAAPATDTFIALYSTGPDFVGAIKPTLLEPSPSLTISASGGPALVTVGTGGERFLRFEFDAAAGKTLTTGYYPFATAPLTPGPPADRPVHGARNRLRGRGQSVAFRG
ncbi:MAG: hypothetical protein M3083_12135 [Actinomycetota bacterium]|nr:hypothetical protein [Actinomycetota bacterium]